MDAAFRRITLDSREYLECVPLAARARHLFSTRQLELPSDPAMRRQNIDHFATALGVEPSRLLRGRQVHGSVVLVADPADLPAPASVDADAVASAIPGTACAVQIADCVSILVAGGSGVRGFGGSPAVATLAAVAAVHAGWRGTAAGVAAEAVRALARLGAKPATLVAALGPSIGPCCYQVDARVRDVFAQSPYWASARSGFVDDGEGHWRLDVSRINRAILEQEGVPASQIHESRVCTACDLGRFYSYRAEGAGTGRLIAGIAVP